MGTVQTQYLRMACRAFLIFCLLPLMAAELSTYNKDKGWKTPHWVDICGSTFLFSEDTKTWSDAAGECDLYGGHLAQISAHETNYCLLKYSHSAALPEAWYWHSGNDILDEGVYLQFDESMITHAPLWLPGYPQGATASNCLDVALSKTKGAGMWADEPCTTSLHYICQKDK